MICKLCKSENIDVVWNKPIRSGGLGMFTKENVPMYRCNNCCTVWHDLVVEDLQEYYESNIYRDSVDGSHDKQDFYSNHDKEVLNRLEYTGTTMFRNKSVADIGCAAGTFLDYVNGVANEIVAIEPSEYFRDVLKDKGYEVYSYARNCIQEREKKLDIVVSFSVIEHVEDPYAFMKDIYDLLEEGGEAIVGTPSDAPLMCELLGDGIYESEVLYSVQHLWVFSAESIRNMCKEIGFKEVHIETYQRYGLANLFGWLKNKKARHNVGEEFCDGMLDQVFKQRVKDMGMGDYLVAYLKK